ncbi:proline-rich protein 2-like [Erinaceus europaeus]|uniref:Proline-rich protein 2-like n=1 Tax=Erinaceus europaeus TaxID=9365 RepID=A0ABM3WVZ1_ERIEU|nr:proline-rich protein 2-like [Erinaceus europaeus]
MARPGVRPSSLPAGGGLARASWGAAEPRVGRGAAQRRGAARGGEEGDTPYGRGPEGSRRRPRTHRGHRALPQLAAPPVRSPHPGAPRRPGDQLRAHVRTADSGPPHPRGPPRPRVRTPAPRSVTGGTRGSTAPPRFPCPQARPRPAPRTHWRPRCCCGPGSRSTSPVPAGPRRRRRRQGRSGRPPGLGPPSRRGSPPPPALNPSRAAPRARRRPRSSYLRPRSPPGPRRSDPSWCGRGPDISRLLWPRCSSSRHRGSLEPSIPPQGTARPR